jgi:hypothetical protein
MKTNTISIEADGLKIKGTSERMVQVLMAGLLAQTLPPTANVQPVVPCPIPAVGEYWPGQGGVNGGFVPARGDIPEHYLIFADKDLGEHKWGRYGEESVATSKWDGKANTDALIAAGGHPAAEEARAYTAEGHADFDLPAAAQLHQAWVYDLIAKGAYWSSTQRSANDAFDMHFADGNQGYSAKITTALVRPVRRFFI